MAASCGFDGDFPCSGSESYLTYLHVVAQATPQFSALQYWRGKSMAIRELMRVSMVGLGQLLVLHGACESARS